MFQELPEGQTHSWNDGCGEQAHNVPKEGKVSVAFIQCRECKQQAPIIKGEYKLIHSKGCARDDAFLSPTEQLIDEMVRDFTSVEYIVRPKSEVRRRINELVAAAQKEKKEPEQLIYEGWEKRFDKQFWQIGATSSGFAAKGNTEIELKDFIRKEIAELQEETQASRILWERMTEWRKEWSAAHPEQPLTWPDALKMLEWKIAEAYERGKDEKVFEVAGEREKLVAEAIERTRESCGCEKCLKANENAK